MGIKSSTESNLNEEKYGSSKDVVNKNSFNFISIIGRGGFGKVWKVFNNKYKKNFAMKEMSKAKIIDKKSEKSIKSEHDLLSRINHKFIINMHFAFQDKENLYLVMDLLTGGDLRYHICKYRKFSEEQTKFFIACILLGLEYCHYNRIIHRDIKPENLVLDEKGYVHITDFGIAKLEQENNSKETSGTPGYMSPEVICAQNHTVAVDSFAVGVIGYEFMMGFRPYLGKSRKEIKEKIMARQVQIKKDQIPPGWSIESADCINRMLQRKPVNRLGKSGAKEVKDHCWFKDFNWEDLYNKSMISPFIPSNTDNFDFKYCNAVEKQGLKTKERYAEIYISDQYRNGFSDYFYFDRYSSAFNEENCFKNPHEFLYENKQKVGRDLHNRNNSYDAKYQSYKKLAGVGAMHARSASTINSNQAFFEASQYVDRRNLQKRSLMSAKGQRRMIENSQTKVKSISTSNFQQGSTSGGEGLYNNSTGFTGLNVNSNNLNKN